MTIKNIKYRFGSGMSLVCWNKLNDNGKVTTAYTLERSYKDKADQWQSQKISLYLRDLKDLEDFLTIFVKKEHGITKIEFESKEQENQNDEVINNQDSDIPF